MKDINWLQNQRAIWRIPVMISVSGNPGQSTNVLPVGCTTQTATVLPFVITSLSPPPRPKDEVLDLEELEQISLVSGIEQVVKPMTENVERYNSTLCLHGNKLTVNNNLLGKFSDEFLDLEELEQISLVSGIEQVVKPMTQNPAENVERCATCQEYVPRNLVSIRDHVKVHFGEKTNCMIVDDLTKLLPTLQHHYCQLFMTSFPLTDCIPTQIETRKNAWLPMKIKPKYICDSCGMETIWKHNLHAHISNRICCKLSPSKGPYICDICGCKHTRKGSLFGHISHFHGNKCHACPCWNCKRSYKRNKATPLVNNPEVAAVIPTFNRRLGRVQCTISAWKQFPRNPANLEEIEIPENYRQDFVLHISDDKSTIILATEDNIRKLAASDEWYCDGMFSNIPRLYKQMWSIHIFYHGKQLPVVYCLLTEKSAACYRSIFVLLKEYALQFGLLLAPRTFRSDFETGLFPAIATEFPNCMIKGCHFHFCQDIYKHVQELGLANYFRDDALGQKDIRYLMAIPFLSPAEVIPWFNQWVDDLPVVRLHAIRDLIRYFRNFWLTRMPIDRWNMYKVERRTNNNVEGFHSGFKQLVGHDYLHFFKFLTKLQQNQAATELLIRQIDTGQNVIRPVSPTYQRINNTIRNLTAQYDLDGNGTNLINGIYHCLAQPLNIAL